MTRPSLLALIALPLALITAYLLLWPVDAAPMAWHPQPTPGYRGPHAMNKRLESAQRIPIAAGAGPEHVALGPDGRVYAGLGSGVILRMAPDGSAQQRFADTGGRVLGLEFDRAGNLIAADAYKGLVRVGPDGQATVLTAEVAPGDPIRYADAVAISGQGLIYFTEGSHHFAPGPWGDPLAASVAEILEQKGNGRVLVYDPNTGRTEVVAQGLVFANGIVVSHDGHALLVVETGRYRVWRIDASARNLDLRDVQGPQARLILDNLPAFPDNLTRGSHGLYWLGLPQARSSLADSMAPWPFLRTISLRLPFAWLPTPAPYGHVIGFDDSGEVRVDLQDPSGRWHDVTGATETAGRLYLHSLKAPAIGILAWPQTFDQTVESARQ